MATQDDRAADKRVLVAIGALMVVEVVLGSIADAGAIGLGVWLVLAVGAVLVTGVVFTVVHRRAAGKLGKLGKLG